MVTVGSTPSRARVNLDRVQASPGFKKLPTPFFGPLLLI